MATSDLGGIVALRTNNHVAETPVSTHLGHALANNANHLADEDAQVLVAWASTDGTGLGRSSFSSSTYKEHWNSGPILIRLQASGVPYPVRIRVRAKLAGANTSGNVAVVISPPGEGSLAFESDPPTGDNVAYGAMSTTAGWVSLTFGSGTTNILQMSRQQADRSRVQFPSPTAIGGGTFDSVSYSVAELSVWVTANQPESPVEISGVYAAQYIGA